MSYERNLKHDLSAEEQDDHVPQKKLCMDRHHDNTEDANSLSDFKISNVDTNNEPSCSSSRFPNFSSQLNQNKQEKDQISYSLNAMLQNKSLDNTEVIQNNDRTGRTHIITPPISEQSQHSHVSQSFVSHSSVDSRILWETSNEPTPQNSYYEQSQDSLYPKSLTPQNSIYSHSFELSSREATPQSSSDRFNVENSSENKSQQSTVNSQLETGLSHLSEQSNDGSETPQLSEQSREGSAISVISEHSIDEPVLFSDNDYADSDDSEDYLQHLLYGPICTSDGSESESSEHAPTSSVDLDVGEDEAASVSSNNNEEIADPIENDELDIDEEIADPIENDELDIDEVSSDSSLENKDLAIAVGNDDPVENESLDIKDNESCGSKEEYEGNSASGSNSSLKSIGSSESSTASSNSVPRSIIASETNSVTKNNSVVQSTSASKSTTVCLPSISTASSGESVTIAGTAKQCDKVPPSECNYKVDRQILVMKIMKTFKSNFLYDSFCYALPRSEYATNAYTNTVSGILNLADQCKFGLAEPDTVNFPSKESIDFAEGIVEDMRNRYEEMLFDGNKNDKTNKELNEILDKEVDNDLPHNIVFMVSDGTTDIASTWCGQFQVGINPITNVLSLRMFEHNPVFTDNVSQYFCQGMLTEEVCKGIINEMEKFEISRQLRMDIDLKGFDSLTFVACTENECLLLIKVGTGARFYQRFLNSTASDRNKWHERDKFLPFEHEFCKDYVLMLGGVASELSNLAAQVIVACPNIKIVNAHIGDLIHRNMPSSPDKSRYTRSAGEHVKLSIDRRNDVIEILYKNSLISQDKREELQKFVSVNYENISKGRECNFLDNLEFHPCFCDFLNYHCLDVSELEHQLSRRCTFAEKLKDSESASVINESDDPNITVAQFLSMRTDFTHYYSFCSTEFSANNMWHCNICGKCNHENEWHCASCNKCSKNQSVCEHCGFDGYSFRIKPGSVDQTSPQKPEWKVKLATQDIPDWPTIISHSGKETSFNLERFMQDELGLIDPVAFLLGSEARGGGNRQGRRLQKYEKGVRGNPQMLAAAGCVLQ